MGGDGPAKQLANACVQSGRICGPGANVFFYGGSNVSSYTADPVYDGAKLAKTANAVV